MQYDFRLLNAGSILILTPLTIPATEWIEKNLSDDRMYWNSGVCIEPRYMPAILDGIAADGFSIQ
jgi:hypothetical protein